MERVSAGHRGRYLTDGLPTVGPWAKQKLDALARYLDYYTKVLKHKSWRRVYLDAYAGGGQAVVRIKDRSADAVADLFGDPQANDPEARELLDGSPRVALGIVNPFHRYVFVDPDPDRVAQLMQLRNDYEGPAAVTVQHSTAADAIDWIVGRVSSRTHRGVAFLDPFGTKLTWASIEKLARTGLFEVIVNYAYGMAIQRLLPNNGQVPDGWAATLDAYFGGRGWFDAIYRPRDGFFAGDGFEKRDDAGERLLEFYRSRLRDAFGFVSSPRLIRNTRGSPLYYLVWAGPHKAGLKGAEYILTMGDRLPPGRRRTGAA